MNALAVAVLLAALPGCHDRQPTGSTVDEGCTKLWVQETMADLEKRAAEASNPPAMGQEHLRKELCGEYEKVVMFNSMSRTTFYLKDGVVIGHRSVEYHGANRCQGTIPRCE